MPKRWCAPEKAPRCEAQQRTRATSLLPKMRSGTPQRGRNPAFAILTFRRRRARKKCAVTALILASPSGVAREFPDGGANQKFATGDMSGLAVQEEGEKTSCFRPVG